MGLDSVESLCLDAFVPHKRFIHVAECISILFLCIFESCSVCINIPKLIYLLMDSWALSTLFAVMNVLAQVFLGQRWFHVSQVNSYMRNDWVI